MLGLRFWRTSRPVNHIFRFLREHLILTAPTLGRCRLSLTAPRKRRLAGEAAAKASEMRGTAKAATAAAQRELDGVQRTISSIEVRHRPARNRAFS